MAKKIYHVTETHRLKLAGPTDIVELLPAPGANSLFLSKNFLDVLTYAITHNEFIHISGPTGSAKSSVLEAFALPENYCSLCETNDLNNKRPICIYPVEMATFESPAELFQRRSLKNGSTYDEPSTLIVALQQASRNQEKEQPLIWLREMGRVHSASVQGGLLNLMCKTDILLPDGSHINGTGIAWVADSNYQADSDSTHTLVTLDDALKRRFSINLTLGYLPDEQEEQVLQHLLEEDDIKPEVRDLIPGIVRLGNEIREQKMEGNLQSITPPTIYGYLALLRLQQNMPYISLQDAMNATLLGNASQEDSRQASALFNRIFGLQSEMDLDDDNSMGGDWI
ncbi:MAG: hypothetical protein U9Q39_01975 [Pseudomonadota bacterium]|nr:hypothetical protein [Pseudomonadota bacterium]